MKISDFPLRTQASFNGIISDHLPDTFKQAFQVLYENNVISDGIVVYDIGANCGNFTKLVKSLLCDVRVIGFEAFDFHKPVHDFFEFETYFCGLSNVNEKKTFFYPKEQSILTDNVGNGNSYYKENGSFSKIDYDNEIDIQCYRLDDFKKEHNLPQPDLIKIDVQGAEKDVILGGIETIMKAKVIILEVSFVEYNIGGVTHNEIANLMQTIGFNKFFELNKTPYDGDFVFIRDDIEFKILCN